VTVLNWPKLDKPLGPPNPDAWLRLAQVRQWLTRPDFFDHAVRHTNAPFGGITTPWTRVLDALLAALSFLAPGLPIEKQLMAAAAWLPPLLCAAATWAMAKAARRYFGHFQVTAVAVVLMLCNAFRIDYFSPGDADHHGLLSALWCGVLCFVAADGMTARAALALGALLGTMAWVSPEGLALVGAVYALLGLEALFRPRRMATLALATLGAALVASLGLLVERPWGAVTADVYDTLSIVHVALLWLTAAGAVILAFFYRGYTTLATRTVAATLSGAIACAAMWRLYPKFFLGPLVDADPFIITGFLPHITELRALWEFRWPDILREMALPLLAGGLALFAGRSGLEHLRPKKKRFLLIMGALLVMTAALTLWEVRWEYYLQPAAIVLAAALLPAVATKIRLRHKWMPARFARPCLWAAALFAVTQFTTVAFMRNDPDVIAKIECIDEVRYVIQTGQLQMLFGDTDTVIFTPANAGGDMQFFTPYGIIASNYHREGQGLKDIYALETAQWGEAALPVLAKRHVRAMLYCPGYYPPEAWLNKIGNETQRPDWLTPAKHLRFFEHPGTYIPKPVLFRVEQ
jgi:hypothetical protein